MRELVRNARIRMDKLRESATSVIMRLTSVVNKRMTFSSTAGDVMMYVLYMYSLILRFKFTFCYCIDLGTMFKYGLSHERLKALCRITV